MERRKSDLKGIREFMRNFTVRSSIVVTKDETKRVKDAEGTIEFVPARMFLLSSAANVVGAKKRQH